MDGRARWSDGACGRGLQAVLGGDAGPAGLAIFAAILRASSRVSTGAVTTYLNKSQREPKTPT